MKWIRRKGAQVPAEEFVDPLEAHGDAAAAHFGFDEAERAEYLALQRRLAGNPRLMKQLVKRQRRIMKAQRMSPTIKSK